MITLLLMFLACESNKAETTNTTDNNTPEQVETTETPKTTEKKSKESSEVCPECMSDDVHRKGPRSYLCNVCYHEWV